ncbi:MATE family efflux transporter [Spirochaetia bacterium]|nr:MATE family efflux transporter [Spirochaetia bacterium]
MRFTLPPLFNDRVFYKNLFIISFPIMLQNLVNSLVNMLDTVMIGQLGTVEIAAVGLGNQVFFLYNLTLFGICSGASIFTAQFWGKRDLRGIRMNTGFCLILSLSVALIFTAAALTVPGRLIGFYSEDPEVIKAGAVYLKTLAPAFIPFAINIVMVLALRSVERLRLAVVSTVIALSMNAVLNYLLIFGVGPFPAMGVAGAAAATVISRITEMIIILSVSYIKKYPVAGSLKELLGFTPPFVGRFIKIALPVIINEIVWSTGITLHNAIMARTGTAAIAAFNIVGTVSQLTWVVFMGLGNGVGVMIGKKIGEGDEAAARDYASRIIRFAPLLSIGAAMILLPLSRLTPLVFNVDKAVLAAVFSMFIVLCISYPARAFNMSMVIGICRAGGDTVFCTIYDLLFMWTISLPLAAAASFIFHAPVWLVYLFITMEEPLKVILGFWRFRSGKWLHQVTKEL